MKRQTKTKEQFAPEPEKTRKRVSGLEQAAEELREREHYLNEAQAIAHLGHWKLDPETQEVSGSDEFFRIFGLDRDEATLASFTEVVHPDDREYDIFHVRRGIEHGLPWDIEHRLICRDGTEKWVHAVGEVISDESGKVTSLLGTVQDITERKRAEEASTLTAVHWQDTFDAIEELVTIIDKDFHVVQANRAMDKAFAGAKVLGAHCYELMHGTEGPIPNCPSCQTFSSGEVAHAEVCEQHLGGRWFDVYTYPIKDKDGTVQQVVHVVRDITERKRMQEALQKREYEANERVKELNCLYGITDLAAIEGSSLQQILEGTVSLITPGLQYPEVTCARITSAEQEFKTENFGETKWRLSADIIAQGQQYGTVEVYYLEERPDSDEGPFLKEERNLVNAIAQNLGRITERKRAEQELKDSDERYKAIFDRSLYCVYVSDFEGNFLDANDAALDLLGYTREEAHSLNFASLLGEEYIHEALKILDDVKRAGSREKTATVKLRKKDGDYVLVETETTLLYREGKPYAIQGIAKDITEQKRAEGALKDSEEKLRTTFETMSDGIAVTDVFGNIVEVNEATVRLHGYSSREDIIGRNALDFIAEKDRAKAGEDLGKGIEKGSTALADYALLTADGGEVEVEASASALRDISGNTVGLIAVMRDVTERKQAEEALRASDEKMRVTFDSISDAVAVIDLEGHFAQVNEAAARMTGFTKEELVGRNVLETMIAEKDRDKIVMDMAQTMEEGDAMGIRSYTLVTKDGREFESEFSTAVLRDSSGNIINFVGVARDVTERRQAEEERERLIREVERSNAELEQFANIISHDLQEPLRMVASYTQLLEKRYKGSLDADADEFIGYAVDGASRMQNLIQGLLSYSRVGTRGKPFEPTECESVLKQTLDNLKVAIDESGAGVTHDPLPRVMADETQLIQLFQNLLANAIKFRGEEQPRIHVSAKENSNECLFSVSDNGIGINSDYFDRIFVIFQRLHGREEYPGTGIGLSVCKRIVERHGGRIWVESQPGEGTTFHFTIPKGSEEQ